MKEKRIPEYKQVVHDCGQELYLDRLLKPHEKVVVNQISIFVVTSKCPKCHKLIWTEFDQNNKS